jgi:acyl-CoA synthetase (AMP-forming)/AMP-acid ligase II
MEHIVFDQSPVPARAARSAVERPAHARYATLVDLLRQRAEQKPTRRAFTFLRGGQGVGEHLTFGDLDAQARRMAARLQHLFRQGDRVLLAYASGYEFVPAFFGCMYAGVVPVLASSPNATTDVARLQRIAADSGAAGLCTGTVGFNVRHLGQSMPSLQRQLRCLELTGDSELPPPQAWTDPGIDPADPAFLQYTSGSTGAPKGVVVSHANVVDNQLLIESAFGASPRTRAVSWLPPHQDMGLIGHVVQPMHLGITSVLMSAASFVASPARWLQAITDHRATISGGPNFAFELCIRRVTGEQMRTLDLSSWEVAFNGSEMVRAETMERFAEKFASCGFRREAFVSCYGIAEATLFVSASQKGHFPATCRIDDEALPHARPFVFGGGRRHARKVVSCGMAAGGRLVVVEPHTRAPCAEGAVGEVWLRGGSVVSGYAGHAAAGASNFDARLAHAAEGGWFRTGDLGLVRGGELFVIGSLHDLVELDGRHYHPDEIEDAVRASHPALREREAAAFTVEANGRSRLIVVQELERREWRRLPHADVQRMARSSVRTRIGVRLQQVLLLPEGSLPKTPGGKVRRFAARDAFMNCAWASGKPFMQ